ncbi:hypothetical protein G3O08_05105 [Cryomorpha ignava]|uniref:TonB-dependent receptor n=1 Tax=Cryomorpha ignava TaxID=101383 RepID=A0A7K3WN09_9FLAO|nr:hypothetical protein [Cryomorpha ignava]NEN22874.1 hypothetical protein [Cryomorpha ignava]
MKYATIKSFLVFSVVLVSSFAASAQGGEGDAFDQTQIITGDRTLTVQKAFKISEMPTVVDIPVQMGTLTYEMIPKRPATEITPEPIEPATVKIREPLEKLYHGFVKAGAGTFATPYVEAFYTSNRDRDKSYGVHARHLSSHDGVNQPVAFSGFSETNVDLWGKKIFKQHSLQTDLGYALNGYHYYGFDPQDAEIDKKDMRQRFNDFSLSADYRSYYRDSSRINHNIGLDSYYYSDSYDANEIGVKATTQLRSWRGDQYYTLDGGLDFVGYNTGDLKAFDFMSDSSGIFIPANDYTNVIFHATPRILLVKNGFRAMAGLAVYGQFDSKARFHAFPDLEVSYSLFNDIFIPYAGVTGSVERNSYKTLSRENPFILSNLSHYGTDDKPLINSIVKYDLFGGIRGTLSDKMSFNTRIGYKKVDETPLFVNDTLVSEENRFLVIYDQVQTFSMMGELSYKNSEKWSATARGEIFTYSANDEQEAWHMPKYRFSLLGSYTLFEKLSIGAEMALVGKRYAKSLRPVSDVQIEPEGFYKVELDPYFDLTLKAEYRYSNRISAFIEANNLTGTKYDQYYRFPVQRVFLLGGLKFAF